MRFQLLTGSYHSADGRSYKRGDVVTSKEDLAKRWVNMFARVGVPLPNADLVQVSIDDVLAEKKAAKLAAQMAGAYEGEGDDEDGKAPEDKPKKAKAKPDAALLAARGVDSTTKFDGVAENGFVVCKREKRYHVYEGDATKPLNPEGLKESQVAEFVKDWLNN